MDKLKAFYPDKFLSNRETQIELLARVADGFLDGEIDDIDDPTPVFTDFKFKGDYGKGESARKVEVDLSELTEQQQYIVNGYIEKYSKDTDHAEAYKWAIERLKHVDICIKEKGHLDRTNDRKGKKSDWKQWMDYLLEVGYLKPVKIKLTRKSKTVFVPPEKSDGD